MSDLMGASRCPWSAGACRGSPAHACRGARPGRARDREEVRPRRELRGLAVIGAGKLGGRELIYGSDLDILFVYDEARARGASAGHVGLRAFQQNGREGDRVPCDDDARGIRVPRGHTAPPHGIEGPLVQSIEAVRSYYDGRPRPGSGRRW